MALNTELDRVGARLDRLPAAWAIATGGYLLHLALAVGLVARSAASGEQVQVLVSVVLVAVLVLAGLAALPALVLWWLGRYERVGAVLALAVAVGTLVVNDAHPTVWPFPLALGLAAARAWAGQALDATDLLVLDPGRFERVEPATDDAGSRDSPDASPDEPSEASPDEPSDRRSE